MYQKYRSANEPDGVRRGEKWTSRSEVEYHAERVVLREFSDDKALFTSIYTVFIPGYSHTRMPDRSSEKTDWSALSRETGSVCNRVLHSMKFPFSSSKHETPLWLKEGEAYLSSKASSA